MDDNRLEYYGKGYYLHRLYLTDNPLIREYSTKGQINKAKKLLDSMIKELRQKEDVALAHLAEAFMGPDNATPKQGEKFLKDFVAGDGGAILGDISDAFKKLPHDQETNKYILDNEEEQKRIVQATINALDNKLNNDKQEFIKATAGWKDRLERSLQEIKFQSTSKTGEFIKDRPVAALEGEFFERVVPEYFNLKFKEALLNRKGDFDKFINLEAEFTGQNSVENANLALGKKQPFDVNIKFSYDEIIDELPMQIKAKPMSFAEEINLYTHMNIINLISNTLDEGQKKALQTAIINQHYWSQGAYRNKVDAIAKKVGYDLGFKGRGHPTAIERLDEKTTIGPLRGVLPLMRYAIIYNLITGINNVTDQLIYIIVGKGKNSAVLRSSKIISDIIEDVMNIGISGHAVGKRESVNKKGEKIEVPDFIDGSVYDDFIRKTRRPDWYRTIEPKMQNMMNKIAITATLNYSVKD